MGANPLRIRFDKINGFNKIYDGIRYLILYDYEKYNTIYDRVKYLICEKSGITDSINHSFTRIRIDSYNSFPIVKILTFHNVIILIKSVVSNNKHVYYYNISSEKFSYKNKPNTQYF